jgi:hypothetical protein
MRDTIFKRANELQKVHALLSTELSKAWPLIEGGLPMDKVTLVLLGNILDTLDYLLTVTDIPEKLYQSSCKSLFAILAEIQWALPMIAKIETAFGKDCYFLRFVLEKD